MAWCTAAEPVAQAFSTRVAGLKRRPVAGLQHDRGGEILRAEAGVEVPEQDLVHVAGPIPAWASASFATRTIRLSTVSAASLPKAV